MSRSLNASNASPGARRPLIGAIITNLWDHYSQKIYQAILACAKRFDVNLVLFDAAPIGAELGFQYQKNVLFDSIHEGTVDGLILTSGSLTSFCSTQEFQDFLKLFPTLPKVSIALPFDGVPSILVDNTRGIEISIEHLTQVHGKKRIAFVRGPEHNLEANVRFSAYKNSLKKAGLAYDPTLVFPGTFMYSSGRDAARSMLQTSRGRFDAVLSSNDEMALGVVDVFREAGIKVPTEVAVMGFDDIAFGEFSLPPLSTVQQPFLEQVEQCFAILLQMLRGESPPDEVILEPRIKVRTSCGCSFASLEFYQKSRELVATAHADSNETLRAQVLESFSGRVSEAFVSSIATICDAVCRSPRSLAENDLLSLLETELSKTLERGESIATWHDVLSLLPFSESQSSLAQQARILTSQMERIEHARRLQTIRDSGNLMKLAERNILSTLDLDTLLDTLHVQLLGIDIQSYFMSSYRKEIVHRYREKWVAPRLSQILSATIRRESVRIDRYNRQFLTKDLIPKEFLPQNDRFTVVASALYFCERQLGTIVFELGSLDNSVYQSVTSQIASAINTAMLFKAQQEAEDTLRKALDQLEHYNTQLIDISERDDMTGLLNRRGFLVRAEQELGAFYNHNQVGALAFADLDGLKKINDEFGHEAGDEAIRAAAEILKKTFRQTDVLARLGGDEFTVLTASVHDERTSKILDRLQANIDEYNDQGAHPFSVSMSIGFAFFYPQHRQSLSELMKIADQILYQNKKEKKSSG